jgi:peroxiredoxin
MATSDFSDINFAQLPRPEDDGAANHLTGLMLPSVSLPATNGSPVDLANCKGLTVVYIYPMTGRPGVPLPDGWNMIPGARGCSPQSCGFRDHFAELGRVGVDNLFGLSSQDSEYQAEAAARLHLPFPLLSDEQFKLTDALSLPTFEVEGKRLLKRMTLIVDDGQIRHVIYPVFPPNENASVVIRWLRANRT